MTLGMHPSSRKQARYRIALVLICDGRHMAWTVPFDCHQVKLVDAADQLARLVCAKWGGFCEWQAWSADGEVAEGCFNAAITKRGGRGKRHA